MPADPGRRPDPPRSLAQYARRAARYGELRALHAELWPALQAWNRKLAAFTERAGD